MRGKSTADIVSSQLSPPVVERVSATSSSISNNTACAQFSFLYVILRSGLTNQELEISKGRSAIQLGKRLFPLTFVRCSSCKNVQRFTFSAYCCTNIQSMGPRSGVSFL
jgi:hypothetical protein